MDFKVFFRTWAYVLIHMLMCSVLLSSSSVIAESQESTFSREVDFYSLVCLVRVPLVIWDKDGSFIQELNCEDMRIFEDNSPVKIESFEAVDQVQTWVVILFDSSESMKSFLWSMQSAAGQLVSLLSPHTSIALMTFSEDADDMMDFTLNHKAISKALYTFKAQGNTDLVNSLDRAVEKVSSKEGNRIIFVFSDGKDKREDISKSGLKTKLETVVNKANARQVRIYGFAMGYPINLEVMKQITETTGGYFVRFGGKPSKDMLGGVISESMPTHIVSYYTTNYTLDGKWRDISVQTTLPHNRIAHKRGYYFTIDFIEETMVDELLGR